jgi:predicted oxidoreductase (fatty acid repression mutant protein)
MEKKININGSWKSYDIWSPLLGAVIEMHGRVWHDPSHTKEGISHICSANTLNDEIKKKAAMASGFGYFVFWDDQESEWEMQLRGIYGQNH